MACSRAPQHAPHTLRISFNTYPATLDPRLAGDFASSTLICLIYEGLTRCLPGGTVEPALAERVEISPDQKTYTFFLRKAFWSDGTPITAHDFERSWKQILTPPSLSAYLFYPIKNSEKCAKGEVSVEQVGVRALDERTLQVDLEQPTPYFYSLTAFPSFMPAPSRDIGRLFSGPFCIETKAQDAEVVLIKNPTFWNRNQISLDRIHISILPDEMTALQMFERGELDWLGGPLSPLPTDALASLPYPIAFIPSAASTLCTFNTQIAPFNNLNLRKAFSYAIDRTQIAPTGQIAPTSLLPPAFSNASHSFYDPSLAKAFFEKAGLTPEELGSLTLYYKGNEVEKRLAQMLQRQWQEVLGVTVQLAQLDAKSHAQRLQARDYQIALAFWIAQFDDPISILERFKEPTHLKNYPGWNDPLYRELLTEASTSPRRKEILQEAEALLVDQMPLTPLYHWSSPAIASPRIEAIGTTPSGGILFDQFKFAKKN